MGRFGKRNKDLVKDKEIIGFLSKLDGKIRVGVFKEIELLEGIKKPSLDGVCLCRRGWFVVWTNEREEVVSVT